jgi:arylsulfatase
VVANLLAALQEFPPGQRPQSLSIDQIVEKMQKSYEATAQ